MRIGIEAQRIFRKKKHGMDIVALEQIKALQQIDKENSYFIFVKSGEDTSCLQETDNFKIVKVPGVTYADWEQLFLPVYAKLYRLDLLHCTSNTAPFFSPVKTVITLHDIIFLEKSVKKNRASLYQELGRIYRKLNVPSVVRKSSRLITVSHFEKERISAFLKLNVDKVKVVYNSFGKHFIRPADNQRLKAVLKQYFLPENYIFYIGNTDPKKNMRNTLIAYSLYLKDTENPLPLVMADVKESVLSDLLVCLNLGDIRERIILTDYIRNDDLPCIYAGASLFLYPSLRESFGIPVLEAMACGTPVLTANTSALPEVAGNAAFYVNPEDARAIADELMRSLDDEVLRAEFVKKGYERTRSFNWINSAKELLNIYQTA